jgi:hypothetical protein
LVRLTGWRNVDNVLITDDGYENLTTAIKDVDEMERVIRGGLGGEGDVENSG